MLGKTGFFPSACEMPFAALDVGGGGLDGFFHYGVLPTVWEVICSTSRIGTPLRTSEASVRVKRARADFYARWGRRSAV